MKKRVAIKGDKTTTGGVILTGKNSAQLNRQSVACKGDKAYCPACNSTGVIAQGTSRYLVDGIPAALDDYCPLPLK